MRVLNLKQFASFNTLKKFKELLLTSEEIKIYHTQYHKQGYGENGTKQAARHLLYHNNAYYDGYEYIYIICEISIHLLFFNYNAN